MNTIKHQVAAAMVAAAFTVPFSSGCGTEVATAPADVGMGQQGPAAPEPELRRSPDSIDRPRTTLPSAGTGPCALSADAAERLGRVPCPN